MYLILHVFDCEGKGGTLGSPLNGEVEPCPIVIFRVISADPDVELNSDLNCTWAGPTFSALQQFPESKFESITKVPSWKVRWEGGCG